MTGRPPSLANELLTPVGKIRNIREVWRLVW